MFKIRTALYDEHVKLGATIVDFAGFDMPVQYTNIIDEHNCTRNNVGLFDISHMGEFEVKGASALEFLQKVLSNDISRLEVGKAMYCCMLNSKAGIMDDLFVYRKGMNNYFLVVNASNIEKDLKWLISNKDFFDDVIIIDVSKETAKLDLQGPKAKGVLGKLGLKDLPKRFYLKEYNIEGIKVMLSRTGYTGEDGFEL